MAMRIYLAGTCLSMQSSCCMKEKTANCAVHIPSQYLQVLRKNRFSRYEVHGFRKQENQTAIGFHDAGRSNFLYAWNIFLFQVKLCLVQQKLCWLQKEQKSRWYSSNQLVEFMVTRFKWKEIEVGLEIIGCKILANFILVRHWSSH